MKNLFVRGPIQIGKSTSLRTFINEHPVKVTGMCGQRILKNETKVMGYQAKFIYNESLPSVNIMDAPHLENVFIYDGKVVDPKALETVLKKVADSLEEQTPDLIILDEIGGFEFQNPAIMEIIHSIFSYHLPCVGTLKQYKKVPSEARKEHWEEYQAFSSIIEEDGEILDVTKDALSLISTQIEDLYRENHLFK